MEVLVRPILEVHYVVRAGVGLVILAVAENEILGFRPINNEVRPVEKPFVLDPIPVFVPVNVEVRAYLGFPPFLETRMGNIDGNVPFQSSISTARSKVRSTYQTGPW